MADSNRLRSICWASPDRSRTRSAASTATAPYNAVVRSAIGTPTFTGGRSGSPVIDIRPLMPCRITSSPAPERECPRAGASHVGVKRLHRLHVDGLVHGETELLVQFATFRRVVDQDAFGDFDNVDHQLLWHDDHTVAVAANNVSAANQDIATRNWLVDPREGDPARNNGASAGAAGNWSPLTDDLVSIAAITVCHDTHRAEGDHLHGVV